MFVDELIPRLIADVTHTKQNNSASYNLILTKNKDLINKLIDNAGDDIEEKKKKIYYTFKQSYSYLWQHIR